MAKRSLKASLRGIEIARLAFERKGLTQNDLAIEVGLSTRQPIWKFFSRKPIERNFFIEICFFLNLDWQDIAELSDQPEVPLSNLTIQNNADTADFIPDYKTQLAEVVEAQCSFLQSFEIRQPLLLEKIYIDTYVYYHISNQQWIEINSIEQNKSILKNSNLNLHSLQTIPALEAVKKFSKLVILGKPGAGKSTFLQYIALQSQNNHILPESIPIFIRANLFIIQESYQEKLDLVNFIYQQWKNVIIEKEKVESLLKAGKILLLIDGLDEIDKSHQNQLLSHLKAFIVHYNATQIIITSRTAHDIPLLEGFYYVEIADFKSEQIKGFAQKWFKETNADSTLVGEMKAEQFLQTLELPKNQPIKELAVTPIFLNLICSIFQSSNNFPKKREQVYQVGLDILLRQWDEARGINRAQIYENLSLVDKIKLLTDIAYVNFLQGKYFFKKSEVVQIISEHLINNNLAINLDTENLLHTSETILHSIENQHGLILQRAKDIYSFSHLVFQEYLVARKIVNTFPDDLKKQYLSEIAKYIFDPKWREVITLVTSMLLDSSFFLHLMRNKLNNILLDNSRLQTFLQCLENKVNLIEEKYKKSALRAFYFSLFLDRDLSLAIFLDVNLAGNLPEILTIDLAFSRLITISTEIAKQFSLQSMLNLISYLNLENKYNFQTDFKEDWLNHKQKLPNASCGQKKLEDWWKNSGQDWVQGLEQLVGKYRYFETYWNFTPSEQEILKQYYQGNLFFLECLKYHANISEEQKSELEMNLLLPLNIFPR